MHSTGTGHGGSARISFTNSPKLSEHEADQKFNERRLSLSARIGEILGNEGRFRGRDLQVEYAHTGVSSLVCFVESGDGKYVLKIPLTLSMGAEAEAHFLRTWESIGVKVPHVYGSGTVDGHPYVIMEFVDAPSVYQAMHDGSLGDEAYLEMGGVLSRMHVLEAEGFGWVSDGRPQHGTFPEWLEGPDVRKRVKRALEADLLGDEHGSMAEVCDTLLAYSQKRPASSYCHFDFASPNALATSPLTVFDPNPMLNYGIIDLGRTMISTILHTGVEGAEKIKEGYFNAGGACDESVLQASIALNAYWKLPYVHKKGKIEAVETAKRYLAENKHKITGGTL